MPILVIGSTGQVGSEVVNQLLRRNVDVRALVHEEKPELPREVKLIRGDIPALGIDLSLTGSLAQRLFDRGLELLGVNRFRKMHIKAAARVLDISSSEPNPLKATAGNL
ncbi:MAG: NmrA family NAD(P)-binding protein [Verrucomicrobia bacterium]|nr:NmrA family NAD(P)-binding protein [Verrucomicrobiota bacterium]